MAESNATQVILTDDGLKIIEAQSTADNAANGVTNLNDPNLMSVIEKQNNIGQFAGLTSQFNVIVQNAKDDGIDTTAATTAYNNLNKFMADVLADPDHASDIDRAIYKKYQDAYNEELSKLQNALKNNADNKFTSAANATSQAASTASQAFSAADSAYNYADKAQSTAGNALSAALNAQNDASSAVTQASSAASDSKDAKQIAGAVSQSYKTLTDGSTMTIAELQSGLAAKLTKTDLNGYAKQDWTQAQIKLTSDGINGTMSSIKGTVDGQTTSINDLKADSNGFKGQFTKVNDTISKHTTDIGTLQSDAKSLSSNFDSLNTDNGTNQHNISQLQQTAKEFSSTLATVKQGNESIQSKISQLSGDINLRVATKDLISQINLQARNTLISSGGQLTLSGKNIFFDTVNPVIIPSANIDTLLVNKKLTAADISANTFTTNNGTFTVKQDGSVTANNMTLIGGTLSTPTINAGTINGSTINGTTFNAGDIINDANNTSKFYPTTISSDGHIYTTRFNPVDAMQTDLSTGALTTKYRAINTTNPNNHYEAYDTTLQADQIALFAGYTNGKDMSFTKSVTGSNQEGYVLISPLDGLTLHGDNQQITFNGTSDDVTPKGIFITPYGNINPNGTQNIWYVGNNMNMKTAQFGIDAGQNVPISLSRQTLVDEIGALGNRLDMGRLFLHAVDENAQMYLLNDGSPAFVSPTIYNRTYSNGANMFVTSAGRVGRSTSASKYKLAIARSDDTSQADRLMTLNPASWNDKVATEKMAEALSNGETPAESEINLKRHYGLIAEDLRDAGLDEFLITGKDGQIEGIEYDRLWTVLIPKIKQLNNRINELERKTL